MKKIITQVLIICIVLQLFSFPAFAEESEAKQEGTLSIELTCTLPIDDLDTRLGDVTAVLTANGKDTVEKHFSVQSVPNNIALAEIKNLSIGIYQLQIKGRGFAYSQEIEIQNMDQKIQLTDMTTEVDTSVAHPGTYSYGDLNEDGTLNQEDQTLLLQALSGISQDSKYDLDLNGDEIVNLVDLQCMSYSYGKQQTEATVTRTSTTDSGNTNAPMAAQSTENDWEKTIDLKDIIPVSGVKITAPKGSTNLIGDYEIRGSLDGINWSQIATGTLSFNDDNIAEVHFDKSELRYLKLVARNQDTVDIEKIEALTAFEGKLTFLKDGIGILKEDFVYKNTEIPKDTVIFTGKYQGASVNSVIKLYDEKDQLINTGKQLIIPSSQTEGTWVYYLDPDDFMQIQQSKSICAKLYKVTDQQEFLIGKTNLTAIPETLPLISIEYDPDLIQWKYDENQTNVSLIFTSTTDKVTTLQITMQITSAAGQVTDTSATFEKAIKEAYPMAEYVYNRSTGELNIFLSDAKALFYGIYKISLASITVKTSASKDQITLSPTAVKMVNENHTLKIVSAANLQHMSITLEKDTGSPSYPSVPSIPSEPVYNNAYDVIRELKYGYEKEVTFNLDKDTAMSAEEQKAMFQALKGKDKTLILSIRDKDKVLYSFSFYGNQITHTDTVMDFNMKSGGRDKRIEKLIEKGAKKLLLDFSHQGSLPGTSEVKVRTPFTDKQKLYLYYYDEKDNALELVQKNIPVKNGYAAFNLTHCSKYVLTTKPVKTVADLKITASSSAGKGYIRVKWKVKGNKSTVDGYQIFRSTKKNSGYGTRPFFTAKASATSYKNTKSLKKGRRYYYKIRAYKTIDKKKIYSSWSNKAYRTAK